MNSDSKKRACENIASVLRPGDVINSGWRSTLGAWLWPPFYGFGRSYASWRIQRYQEQYFGSRSVYDSTHSRIYLGKGDEVDPNKPEIFEVTVPRSQFVSLADICHEDLRLLRFSERILTPDDIQVMLNASQSIVGTEYDYGQLLDFLLHETLGYPKGAFKLFDQGPKRKVCSTGVTTLFHHLRKVRESEGDKSIPRLFNIVDVNVWKKEGLYDRIDQCLVPDTRQGEPAIKTPIERTAPAHFENTRFFRKEFTLVARFKAGEKYI